MESQKNPRAPLNLRVLGIDPGSVSTGYGIVEKIGSCLSPICFGCIRPKNENLGLRYRTIFEEILKLIDTHTPQALAVETQYVDKNVQSALKLGMVRGIVLLAASLREIPYFEYAPSKAKCAIVGSGRASKAQVLAMVRALLSLKEAKLQEDASDALSIAICHAHNANNIINNVRLTSRKTYRN